MKKFLLAITLLLMATALAFADTIPATYCNGDTCYTDPATLQIGTTVPPLAGDPNLFSGKSFLVYQNQASATNLNNPWLLILGVPNTSAANPFGAGISSIVASAGGATSSNYLGFQKTLAAGQEAYTRLGFTKPDNSNSFTNWSAADLADAGITATSFGLYEFDVNAALAGKGYVTFTFSDLPTGTIAIAYGQTSTTSTTIDKKGHLHTTTNITIYDTPFTEAGLKLPPPRVHTPVPEPASMLLLGSGLCGLGGVVRHKLRA